MLIRRLYLFTPWRN